MPLQNRVDPWGQLHAVQARGAWMGNRGMLHNQEKQIAYQWRHKAWVTCELEFNNRRREIFSPNTYSELFFLDEATAFAAGHRPCAECRRTRYKEFKMMWFKANPQFGLESGSVAFIDKQMHIERANRKKGKVTFSVQLNTLPDGTIFEHDDNAYLIWSGQYFLWTHNGYQRSKLTLKPTDLVAVLTPKCVVNMFRLGFKPQVYEADNSL